MPLFLINRKIIHFVHIPKTGGTSIETMALRIGKMALQGKAGEALPCSPQHLHAALYQPLSLDAFAEWSFAVTRDPLARLLSEYRMRLGDAARRRERGSSYAPPFTRISDLPAGARGGFDAWVRHIFRRYLEDPYLCDNHIRPQTAFLTPGLMRFRIENGFAPIAARLQALCELPEAPVVPHENKGPKADVAVSRETVRRIVDFYDVDYQMLGYAYPEDEGFEAEETGSGLEPALKKAMAWLETRLG